MHPPLPDPPARGVANRHPDTASLTGAGFPDQAGGVAVPMRRRRVWPWVLVALILVAVLAVTLWSTLVVGAGGDGQEPKAGTVAIGTTVTSASGLAVTVSAIHRYTPTNAILVGPDETAYQGSVTLVNGTANAVNTALLDIDVTVGPGTAERIYDGLPPPARVIAVGQQAQLPFRFKIRNMVTGPLQVSVTIGPEERALFTGALP